MTHPLDALQTAVDETVTAWPDVRAKQVFGHRGYVVNGKMLGFIAEGGVAVKAPPGQSAEALYAREDVVPFSYGDGTESRGWPVLPLRDDSDIEFALTMLKETYDRLG